MSAAQVQFRQAAETGGDVNQAPGHRLETIRTGALRSDAAIHADELQRGLADDPSCNLRSSDALRNPDENPLPAACQCGKLRYLARGVSDDPADAVVER